MDQTAGQSVNSAGGDRSRLRGFFRRSLGVWMASAVCVVVSLYAYGLFRVAAREEGERAARAVADAQESGLVRCLRRYGEALVVTRGYFDSSLYVSREEWGRFVSSAKLEDRYPGVWGFGYVERVEEAELGGFVKAMWDQGMGDFEIRGHEGFSRRAGDGAAYVVKYAEPYDRNWTAVGLDASLNPVSREVYERATETGTVQMSRPLVLKQQEGKREQGAVGVVMVLARYETGWAVETVEQRRAAVRGWAVVALDMGYFADSVMRELGEGTTRVMMSMDGFDGGSVTLFDRADTIAVMEAMGSMSGKAGGCDECGGAHPGIVTSYSAEVGGCVLETAVAVDPSRMMGSLTLGEFHEDLRRANGVLFMGIKATLVAVGLMVVYEYGRRRANRVAGRVTESLRRSEQRERENAYHARRANRAKSVFLANMSHEIRTPMTAVLGYAEMLSEMTAGHREPERMSEAVGRIQSAGSHLLMVINDVLDMSKIEAGKLAITPSACRIGEVLAEVVGMMRVRADDRGIGLGVEFVTGVPGTVVVDPYRLRQILLNLVSNGVKFTDRGAVRITVGVEGGDDGKDEMLVVSVHDTGRGIRAERIETLFHPYEQVGSAHGDMEHGTGLGLSISRQLAEMMGGDLQASSVVGVGSVFTCRLPLRVVDEGAELIDSLPNAVSGDHGVGGQSAGVRGRVLVAEDGRDNQRLLGHILGKAGLDVEFVWNGREAVERFRIDGGYDLIILDMQMPVMEGYDAARLLRGNGCVVPILALTANAMSGDRQRCIACGCDEYETKPINKERLLRTIGRLLDDGYEDRRTGAA